MGTRLRETPSVRPALSTSKPRRSLSKTVLPHENGEKELVSPIMIQVEFRLVDKGAQSVEVAGTFNGWDRTKTPLQRAADCWKGTVNLPRGHYEYRFVVDGKWVSDPEAKVSVKNPFGSNNSVLEL